MKLGLTVKGLKEEQAKQARRVRALDPRHAVGRVTKAGTRKIYSRMLEVVHVQSGTLKAALRMDFKTTATAATGSVFIDPGAVKPGTRSRPAVYGVYENAKGGAHAFIERATAAAGFIEQEARAEIEKIVVDGMTDD